MNEKYQAVKVSRSLQMTLSVIAVRQLIVQFSIEKHYSKRAYEIETFFSEENWLIFVEFKGKDAWEAAVFPATAQVNTGNQPLATVATEKPCLVKSSPYLQSVYYHEFFLSEKMKIRNFQIENELSKFEKEKNLNVTV